jgi:hypothetical protein
MFPLRSDAPPEDLGIRVTSVVGDTACDVLVEARDLRGVRAAIIELARFVSHKEDRHRGILVLDDPQITEERLQDDWENFSGMYRPGIFDRLTLVVYRDGAKIRTEGKLLPEDETLISLAMNKERQSTPRSSEAYFDIFRILLNQWVKRGGPVTSKWLCEIAGCTYPTAALALRRLGNYLRRYSDRRVELKAFPKDEWMRLVANAGKVRDTRWFADRSGQPRSVEYLLSRFQKLRPPPTLERAPHLSVTAVEIAIGGIPGVKRYFPNLDVVGTPRLDLTIHSRSRTLDLDFVRRLDPALQPATGDEPARLAIHVLRQAKTFFERDEDGLLWADPVECLLDLHEMRFESQALEMISSLPFESGGAHA